jgi:hypothetical protein
LAKIAQRHHDAAADRSGERRQYQRCACDHEPGIDFLAFRDITAVMGVVETFLRRVFCFI